MLKLLSCLQKLATTEHLKEDIETMENTFKQLKIQDEQLTKKQREDDALQKELSCKV